MRIALVDRHQADLFYAMQLLLEDRLGLAVYCPVGHDWFDAGYWQFGHQHLGRALADQFLGLDATWQPAGSGCYRTFDPAHPERPIYGVTLAGFRALARGGTVSHVVATVEDNQAGFARLAAEVGAQYVLQVGNTRQTVDWSLDPLALVSSEVPIQGRGLRVHQPFDSATTFRYREPGAAGPRCSSFVNLFPRLDDYPLWERVRAGLPTGWETRIYGIDGPDGNLHPVEAIADAMAASAFGIQLKPTGDGFGHVIHNWAAVGRPLVGRAGYYRGQLAEHFWQDGVTCIDLDRHEPAEAAALITATFLDFPRYRAMCEAIRAEFERIDWAAEAAAVRDFLR